MERDLEVIYKAANPQQAAILRNILEEEGIEAMITNLALMGGAGELPMGWSSAPCLMVRYEDSAAARAIAEQFDQDLARGVVSLEEPTPADSGFTGETKIAAEASNDFSEEAEEAGPEPTWGHCPACGEPRRGRCPHCGAFDAYFSPAEYLVTDRRGHEDPASGAESFEVESPLDHFMCSICDEAVQPEPLRYCERCTHDYGAGLVQADPETQSSNPRVVATCIALAILGLAGLLYAFWLTR